MEQSSYSNYEKNRLTRYQILMQRRQHIERIFWSRIQILHLIQAGVLGGSFYLEGKGFASSLLIMGIVLTIILFIICCHDWQDARINDARFNCLGDSLGIWRTAPRWYLFNCKKCKIRTHQLFYAVVGLFIIVDLAVLFHFCFCLEIALAFGWAVGSLIILTIIVAVLVWLLKRFKLLRRESWPPCN